MSEVSIDGVHGRQGRPKSRASPQATLECCFFCFENCILTANANLCRLVRDSGEIALCCQTPAVQQLWTAACEGDRGKI